MDITKQVSFKKEHEERPDAPLILEMTREGIIHPYFYVRFGQDIKGFHFINSLEDNPTKNQFLEFNQIEGYQIPDEYETISPEEYKTQLAQLQEQEERVKIILRSKRGKRTIAGHFQGFSKEIKGDVEIPLICVSALPKKERGQGKALDAIRKYQFHSLHPDHFTIEKIYSEPNQEGLEEKL